VSDAVVETPQSLRDLDDEIEARIAACLPEIICRVIDRVDGTPTADGQKFGPWFCNKPGWRHWCEKHTQRLHEYIQAALNAHRTKKRWRNDHMPYGDVERAESAHMTAQRIYRTATCTCFVDENQQRANEQRANEQKAKQRAKGKLHDDRERERRHDEPERGGWAG